MNSIDPSSDPMTSVPRRFRFGLRTFFVVVALAAVALALGVPLAIAVVTCKIPCGVTRIRHEGQTTTIWRYWDDRIVVEEQPSGQD